MWVVVAYDIPDDTRRAGLARRLKARLSHVQKSVFEGELTPRGFERLKVMVAHRIEPEHDDVRIYVLCPGCRGSTLLMGRARPVSSSRDPIVV